MLSVGKKLKKREAALFGAEATVKRQKRELLAHSRVLEAETEAAADITQSTYASVYRFEIGIKERPIRSYESPSTSAMYENLPNPL